MDARTEPERLADAAEERRSRPSIRKVLKWAGLAIVLLVGVVFAVRYWLHSRNFVSTDNAYVNADVVQVAAQVSGPVEHLFVQDQQRVPAGAVLFEIDPRPFQLQVEAAEAQLEQTRQSVSQRKAAVAAAQAALAQRRAELRNAESNEQRTLRLIQQKFLSQQEAEATRTQMQTATAAVRAAEANVTEAQSALGEGGGGEADIRAAQAQIDKARLDLERTRVITPTSGTIGNLTLRPGNPVTAQTPLFSIISDGHYWVDANFKETQLQRLRAGQRATVVSDMYRGHVFTGEVESLSGASGTAFSLLPPQNATGNWVKVTQRVPVRVRILDPDPKRPLRIGTTATVQVKAR